MADVRDGLTVHAGERGGHDSAAGLVAVEVARERVLEGISPLASLELPLTEAYGCVVARDLVAERDMPEFASSAMDGFALRASDVAGASSQEPVELRVVGRALIGRRPDATVGGRESVRIATGAPIPSGADAVVPIEDCEPLGERVRLRAPIDVGRHVRPSGQDVAAGELLVPGGRRIGAPEMGLLANAGFPHPPVHPRARVVVLSTGDELVQATQETAFGQVRDSNAPTLYGALREAGASPVLAGSVPDDEVALREAVSSHLVQADAFISTGGVSVGERDVVKNAFFRRGDVDFYRVAMQPGMPQGFGHVEGKPYFALPGNPVSVFVSFEMFVRPALMKMMGRAHLDRPQVTATLDADVEGPAAKLQLARVRVHRGEGGFTASPTGARGSNLISTVARANGLAMIPPGTKTAPAGSEVRVMLFRAMED
jgi:molybdopterin molybdotransferase